MKIDGRFWFSKDSKNFLGNGRIEILEQIEKTGSISAAAKTMKMSYKAAWERINQMNNLADYPIIKKVIGGKGGGGTVLTQHAHELITTYKSFQKLHRQFIERFGEAGDDPEQFARILSRTFLTTSARNQFSAKILSIQEHGINALIELQLNGGEKILADITMKSVQNMGLKKNSNAYAIIKSSDVFISNTLPEDANKTNILQGSIQKIESIADNTEITFVLDGGETLIGVISLKASTSLNEGSLAYACIAKQNIILGL